jgi:hypothetical protein
MDQISQFSQSTILAVIGIIGAAFVAWRMFSLDQKTQAKVAIAEGKAEAETGKSKPAWDLARVTLEAYFNRNLSQIVAIFWLSVIVMVLGFAIIGWGISRATQSPNALAPAAMATLAGIISQFIGATFLFVYRSTVQQASNYARTLERINSIGMAMQIMDTMPDNASPFDLKTKTKAALVEVLVRRAYEVPEGSPPPKTE